jgi:hypothetical protein
MDKTRKRSDRRQRERRAVSAAAARTGAPEVVDAVLISAVAFVEETFGGGVCRAARTALRAPGWAADALGG